MTFESLEEWQVCHADGIKLIDKNFLNSKKESDLWLGENGLE